MRYRKLGKTGLMVSEIGFGGKCPETLQGTQPVPVKVIAKDETTVTFDANHEMAGKELNFRIELVEVR